MKIDKIQDDGGKFILYGKPGLRDKLEKIFSNVGLGISVEDSDVGVVNVLYTENNRDIVLRVIRDQKDG